MPHIYHTGCLAIARCADAKLDELASAYWNDAQDGKVFLTQRKIAQGVWEYLATPAREGGK